MRRYGPCFGVAPSIVVRWSRHYRQTGSFAPGKMGGHRPVLLEPHRDFIIERLKQVPHMTTGQLQKELAARGVVVCQDTVWRFLRRQGLSFKKSLVADERSRRDVAWRRQRWKTWQGRTDAKRLSSLMRPGSGPTWRRCAAGGQRENG